MDEWTPACARPSIECQLRCAGQPRLAPLCVCILGEAARTHVSSFGRMMRRPCEDLAPSTCQVSHAMISLRSSGHFTVEPRRGLCC